MPSKLLHVLGGGLWQLPTVKLAKDLGYRVLVTDIYTERPAYEFADYHEVMDIRDFQGTLEIAQRYGINGVLCVATDVGVPTAAYVAEMLHLPGTPLHIAETFTYKDRMRAATSRAGIPTPDFAICTNLEDAQIFFKNAGRPIVLKPVDSQSSRGVTRVSSDNALEAAFDFALSMSPGKQIIAEVALNGTEITVETIVSNGIPFTVGISDKRHFAAMPQVASRLTYPADFPPSTLSKIEALNRRVVSALEFRHGITHAEYFVDDDGEWLVEIAARGGGSGIYSRIVPYLSGIDVPKEMIEFAVGDRECISAPADCGKRAANLEFLDFPAGVVQSISGLEEASRLPGVDQLVLEFDVGTRLGAIEDDRSRPGFVLVLGATRDEVLSVTERVKQLVKVDVTPS